MALNTYSDVVEYYSGAPYYDQAAVCEAIADAYVVGMKDSVSGGYISLPRDSMDKAIKLGAAVMDVSNETFGTVSQIAYSADGWSISVRFGSTVEVFCPTQLRVITPSKLRAERERAKKQEQVNALLFGGDDAKE